MCQQSPRGSGHDCSAGTLEQVQLYECKPSQVQALVLSEYIELLRLCFLIF